MGIKQLIKNYEEQEKALALAELELKNGLIKSGLDLRDVLIWFSRRVLKMNIKDISKMYALSEERIIKLFKEADNKIQNL